MSSLFFERRFRCGAAVVLLACIAPAAVAWDVAQPLPDLPPPAAYTVATLAAADPAGFWSAGSLGAPPVLVRHAANGDVRVVRYLSAGPRLIASAGDAGVYTSEEGALSRYDAAGTLRWTVYPPGESAGEAFWAPLDAGPNGLWAIGFRGSYSIYRIADDGSIRARLALHDLGFDARPALSHDPAGGYEYFAGGSNNLVLEPDKARAVFVAVDNAGTRRWQWRSAEALPSILQAVAASADGVVAAGIALSGNGSDLVTLVAARDGTGLHAQRLAGVAAAQVLGVAATAQGERYVLSWTGQAAAAQFELRRLDANGQAQWTRSVGSGDASSVFPAAALRVDSAGNALVAVWHPLDDPMRPLAVRYRSDGGTLATNRIPASSNDDRSMTLLPDDSAVFDDPAMTHIGKAGETLVSPRTASLGSELPVFSAAALGGDSVSDVLAQLAGPYRSTLAHVSATGQILWRQDYSGLWLAPGLPFLSQPQAGVEVRSAGDRVCIAGAFARDAAGSETTVECRRRADGTLLWRKVLDTNPDGARDLAMRVLADGRVILLRHPFPDEADYTLFDAQGNAAATVPFLASAIQFSVMDSGSAGDLAVLQYSPTASGTSPRITYLRIAAGGGIVGNAGLDDLESVTRLALAADGSALVVSAKTSGATRQLTATRFDAQAHRLWSKPLATIDAGLFVLEALTLDGDAAYYTATPNGNASTAADVTTAAIALSDGSVRWTSRLPAPADSAAPLWVASRAEGLTALYGERGRLRLREFARQTGALLRDYALDCGMSDCSVLARAAPRGSQAQLVLTGTTPDHGNQARYVVEQPASIAAPAVIAQHGIGGAWWAPYARGQGFMIDYLPGSGTFFMPWFTYTRSAENEPAQQRWYTIQGNAAANAAEVELPIYASRDGAFDATAATTAVRVGTATLRFADCANGHLHYRFDAPYNAGQESDISMSRLAAAADACVDAQGTHAASTHAPTAGFDARMSGSWYEPATAGQGVQFAIDPGSLLFATWFTYDPAGSADDDTRQHWFTLQGSLAAAQDGVATVAIAQAIGGSLDAAPTDNQYAVGSAKITVQACDRLRVDYAFDATELAGAYSGKTGTLDLLKIGGCAP